MIGAILLLALAIASGTVLTFSFERSDPFPARLCMGAGIGLALLASIGFIIALWLGLGPAGLGVSAAVVACPLLLLLHRQYRQRFIAAVRGPRASEAGLGGEHRKLALGYVAFYLAIAILLGLVFHAAVYRNDHGIFTGVANNLGDLPLHMQVINSFSQGHNLPPEDPTFAGVRFAYPFLVDFEAAMLVRCGVGIIDAMWLQNMVLALALVGLLHYWTLLLTRNRVAGLIAPLLVLFSGGLGWTWVFQELHSTDYGLVTMLGRLGHDYTINLSPIFRWGNAITTLFVPQRSILFGLPLAIFIFTQWWKVISPEDDAESANSRGRMIAAGVIAGLLPLIHAHTFLVVMGVGACLALIFRSVWKHWAAFFAVALALAAPQVWWLAHSGTIKTQSYLGWQFGWDHGSYNALAFWLVNAGLFIPALLIALFWRDEHFSLPRKLVWFYAPFALCFIVPNLIKLAPWVWDNIKVLFYWYVASVPLVAWLLAVGIGQKTKTRWLAAAAFAAMVMAGGLDVVRAVSGASINQEFDSQGVELARAIDEKAPPRAVVLHAPTYNSPVFLTGRRSVLGYPGWMWSRGLDYLPRNADIEKMYSGAPETDALLRKYGIDYVLISPAELASLKVNEQFWSRFPVAAQSGAYRLYKTKIAEERAGK